jgi:hypothetical protein
MKQANPSTGEVESTLLRLFAKSLDGDLGVGDEVLSLLTSPKNEELQPEIVSTLVQGLKKPDDQILVALCEKLAGFRAQAVSAVPALKQLALQSGQPNTQDFTPSGPLAAICALGKIPGKESLEALLSVIEATTSADSAAFSQVIDSLEGHLDDLAQHMYRIEQKVIQFGDDRDPCIRNVLNDLRCRIRWREFAQLESFAYPHEFDLTPGQLAETVARAQECVSSLPGNRGLILTDHRLPFFVGGVGHGEAGLEIHRLSMNGADVFVVLISQDGASSSVAVSEVFSQLASVVCAMYQLTPRQCVWVEVFTFESGVIDQDEDEYRIATFNTYQPTTGILSSQEFTEPMSHADLFYGVLRQETTTTDVESV